MTRITKPTTFFKRYHYYIMGTFWLCAGILCFILQEGPVYYMYSPLGLGMIIYGYLSKDKIQEFIAWDSSKIIVRDIAEGEKIYPAESIDNIIISNNHLTIKSGAAGGVILDLSGYEAADIQKLEDQLGSGSLSLS